MISEVLDEVRQEMKEFAPEGEMEKILIVTKVLRWRRDQGIEVLIVTKVLRGKGSYCDHYFI